MPDDPEHEALAELERQFRAGLETIRDMARERGQDDIADRLDARLRADRQTQDRAWAERLRITRQ